jgi:hypothetical protein
MPVKERTSERTRKYERDSRKKRWKMIFEFYGGRMCTDCKVCSDYPIYDLHHRIPEEKDFSIGRAIMYKWEKIEKELAKCDLLCSNCHRIRHDVERKQQREVTNGSN